MDTGLEQRLVSAWVAATLPLRKPSPLSGQTGLAFLSLRSPLKVDANPKERMTTTRLQSRRGACLLPGPLLQKVLNLQQIQVFRRKGEQHRSFRSALRMLSTHMRSKVMGSCWKGW